MNGMHGLLRLAAWDIRLQARENVYAFTVLTTAVFAAVLALLPDDTPRSVVAALLFLDPAIVGLSFVGAMVLMERGQNTLSALAVAPIDPRAYIAAKILTLTGLTFAGGIALVFAAYGTSVPLGTLARFVLAIGSTGSLAVLTGLVVVARSRSLNHFIARLFPLTLVVNLPLLAHFDLVRGVWSWILFGLNPGHAMLRALLWAADPDRVSAGEVAYAFAFVGLLIVVMGRVASNLHGDELAHPRA